MTDGRLRQTIAALRRRDCDAEIGCHPGDPRDASGYQWGYQWQAELDALTSPEARRWVDEAGFQLGSYHDLVGRAS